jgi:MoaA/NifB/PqqE/SkfB family radical SAM enzyme
MKKPMLLLRIASNYFRIIVLRKKVVRKVEMGITFDCQCDCPKCSSAFMKDPTKEKLTLSQIEKAAKQIIALGAVQVNLTGGEPLMEKNIFDIIRLFQPNKVLITINTNGLLLSAEMIDKLEAAGVDIIKISLDSPVEQEHDRSRVFDGCFKKVMEALDYIKEKKKIVAQISTVCIKENLNTNKIWEMVELSKRYNALLGLTIPAASGRWIKNEEMLIGKKEKGVLKKLIKIAHVIRDTDEAYMRSHCPAGSEEFYLTCYGDIIPCPLIQISFGNVKKTAIRTIWERMSDFRGFKEKEKPGCLAGENKEFIEKYLSVLKNRKILPLPIEQHPMFSEGNNGYSAKDNKKMT